MIGGAVAGFGVQQMGDAAGGVAAGPRLSAIGIADAHEHIGAGARRFQHDELIATDAEMPVRNGRGQRRGEAERAGAVVKNDEVVAAAMHLDEIGDHGGYIGVWAGSG